MCRKSQKSLSFQFLLGLSSSADEEDCISLVGRHNVLKTLKSINALVEDGPKEKVTTQVWAFTRQDTRLSEEFIQGTQDFSDTSFVRAVDFSKPQEAEELVNSFVEKTSDGKVKSIFKDLNSSSDFLFISSFNFQGSSLFKIHFKCCLTINTWCTLLIGFYLKVDMTFYS